MQPLVAGIFVGGAATRMGGMPKGLLRTPSGETIVARLRAIFDALAIPVVLVGANKEAYAGEGLPILADAHPGIGPLGGLVALLEHARGGVAIGVACDMPFVGERLVRKLAAAPPAPALAPRSEDGLWQPLFARWDSKIVLPIARSHVASGTTSLQRLLDAAGARPLALDPDEAHDLRDWDAPSDVE
jgi:molybdopterin-guanine dinucleotide biosynthesis protein A